MLIDNGVEFCQPFVQRNNMKLLYNESLHQTIAIKASHWRALGMDTMPTQQSGAPRRETNSDKMQ